MGLLGGIFAIAALAVGMSACSHEAPSTTPPGANKDPAPQIEDIRTGPIVAKPGRSDWWFGRHRALVQFPRSKRVDVLFLGDSITEGWSTDGSSIWASRLDPLHAANFGISGDTIGNLLWRLQDGEVDGLNPRLIVLLIGTNNLYTQSANEVAAGYVLLLEELRQRLPNSRILMLAIFPRFDISPSFFRSNVIPANARLRAVAKRFPRVTFLDIGSAFLDDTGTMPPEVSPDKLHLSEKGYQLWLDAMMPTVARLLKTGSK